MPMREDDGGELLDREMLLEHTEAAVPAVDPDRGAALAHQVAAAGRAVRSAVRARAAEDGQLQLGRPAPTGASAPVTTTATPRPPRPPVRGTGCRARGRCRRVHS